MEPRSTLRPTTPRPPQTWGWWLLITTLLALSLPARAAEEETTALPADDAAVAEQAPEPASIDLADVPGEAEHLKAELADVSRHNNSELLAQIEEELPAVHDTVRQISRRLRNIRGHNVSSQRLIAVRTSLAASQRQLREWQDRLVDNISYTEQALVETDRLSGLWEQTKTDAIAQEAPGTVLTQVRASLSAVNRAHNELVVQRDASLETLGEVGIELRRTGRIEEEIDALLEVSRASLFKPDSPPLWRVSESTAPDKVWKDFKLFIAENYEVLLRWTGDHVVPLSAWGICFLAALIFIFSARHQHLERLTSDERLQTTSMLAHHPFSTAVLIALLLVPILLRERTEAFGWLVMAMAVPALLRLVPTLIPQDVRGLARGTVGIYVIAKLAFMFPESSNPARLLYIITEMIIVVGGVRYLLRQRNQENKRPLINFITRLMVLLASVGFLTHVFGLSLLGATIMQGTSASSFLGLSMMAISTTVMAFFRLMAILGPLRHLESIKRHYDTVERQTRRVIFWFVLLLWIVYSLRAFSIYEIVLEFAQSTLHREWQFGSLTLTLGSLVWFVFSVWAAVMVSRILRFFLENDILSRLGLPRGVPSTISMMLHYGIITLGFLVALAAVGIQMSQLSILIGALGVGIGFGLQNVVNNFISGLILIFERPISVSDIVQFGTTTGKVTRIGLRSSIVRTFEGAEIIVPNGNLISNEVINWTLSDQTRRITIPVRVAFGTDTQQVIDLLQDTAGAHDMVLENPAPWAVFEGFGESALDFSLRCWSPADKLLKAKSSLTMDVDNALRGAGIIMPYPQHQVHLREQDSAPKPDEE
jgi:small-conductance mechanosensitive channel